MKFAKKAEIYLNFIDFPLENKAKSASSIFLDHFVKISGNSENFQIFCDFHEKFHENHGNALFRTFATLLILHNSKILDFS